MKQRKPVLAFAAMVLPLIVWLAMANSAAADTQTNTDLGLLWTKVLETPSSQNSFATPGDKYACWQLGNNTVAPLKPGPNGVGECDVPPSTTLFIVAGTVECSTFPEDAPTYSANRNKLAGCAKDAYVGNYGAPRAGLPSITVDGVSQNVTETTTGLLNIVLPSNNLFGEPAGSTGYSSGYAYATVVSPLTTGKHQIVITTANGDSVTTKILVTSS